MDDYEIIGWPDIQELMDEEGLTETRNKRIHIGHPINFDEKTFMSQIEELKTFVDELWIDMCKL